MGALEIRLRAMGLFLVFCYTQKKKNKNGCNRYRMDEPVCITWERSQVGLNWPGHLKQHLIWHGVRESMCITLL